MSHEERALAARRAIVRAGEPRLHPTADLEARLAAALEEVTDLDLEIEALSGALAEFGRRYERLLAAPFAELAAAERLVRHLQALEDEIARLAEALRTGAPLPRRPRASRRRTRGRSAARTASATGADAFDPDPAPAHAVSGGGERDEDGVGEDASAALESEDAVVKRLYRRLARVLHPDLAQDDGERARLSELMARVNAAYAKRDRTALELMAEKVGAGEPLGELTDEERAAHLRRRIGTLDSIAATLRREREHLVRSSTHRLREEARLREAEGRDYFEETRAELAEEAAAAHADALARLDRLARAARDLSRARKSAMSKIVRKGPTGATRAFDPLAESDLVRRGAAQLERRGATGPARELARHLEEAAAAAPAEVALTLLAFFAEAGGARPPETIASAAGLAERWERIREAIPGAPELPRALARLPRHLEVGARDASGDVLAGLQLASLDLAAGVRIALEREGVARIGRQVLAALGPEEDCAACGVPVLALHLMRTRGLDERNGLVCPRCGAVLRSYWRYGEVEGLEALAPHALRLGLVAEQVASLAGTAVGFQMLPAERERLTAERLRSRFVELYLAPYAIELPADAIEVVCAEGPLAPAARLEGEPGLAIAPSPASGTSAESLRELLRARIARRFRP